MYNPPPPQAQPQYAPPPVQQPGYGAQAPQQYTQAQMYQQSQGYGQPQGNALVQQRGVNGGYYSQPPQQQPVQQQQQPPYRAPSPRAPSPQPATQPPPTGQYTDDGRGVLFYGACVRSISLLMVLLMMSRWGAVKAMYNYRATIEEEFDFQEGDIIAVTATPEDGWWSGELLDETRRQPGRHIFPSNFVCLF